MTQPGVVVDSKNCLDGDAVAAAGLTYRGVGRGVEPPIARGAADEVRLARRG